jgi:hypothetical protein
MVSQLVFDRIEVAPAWHAGALGDDRSAASVTDQLWSLENIVARIDAVAPALIKRGPYKKRIG